MPKIELRPFSLLPNRFCKWAPNDLLNYIAGISGIVIEFKGHERHFLASEDQHFIHICIITNLGAGSFTTLDPVNYDEKEWETDDGSINYKKNLCCISKSRLKGIYQTQAETFPMTELKTFFGHIFREFKDHKVREMVAQRSPDTPEKKAQKEAESAYAGTYSLRNEMTQAEFIRMVNEMQEVEDFSWSLDLSQNSGGGIVPELNHAKSTSGNVSFSTTTGRASGISRFVEKHLIQRGRAKGKDINGVDAIYYIQQKYEVMETVSESEWKRRWNKKIPEFYDSLAMRTLRDTMLRNRSRFIG